MIRCHESAPSRRRATGAPMIADPQLLAELRRIAREAGALIMTHYGNNPAVRRKADASPVTAADEAAEDFIIAALSSLAPDIPIISEEAAARGHLPEIAAADAVDRRFWLVDPLDGTREFLSGSGEFTVNIALVEGSASTIGVVHVPPRDVTYLGATRIGGGNGHALRQEADRPAEPIAARAQPAGGAIVLASRSHGSAEALDSYLASQRIAGRVRAGSSLKFCLIAEGVADLYPRFGRTMEWDTAAAHAVLAGAGGNVSTLEGDELAYGKPGFENPHFIARGRPH
jgi:3'(2'), 5'-bisphosphate nucleotidase